MNRHIVVLLVTLSLGWSGCGVASAQVSQGEGRVRATLDRVSYLGFEPPVVSWELQVSPGTFSRVKQVIVRVRNGGGDWRFLVSHGGGWTNPTPLHGFALLKERGSYGGWIDLARLDIPYRQSGTDISITFVLSTHTNQTVSVESEPLAIRRTNNVASDVDRPVASRLGRIARDEGLDVEGQAKMVHAHVQALWDGKSLESFPANSQYAARGALTQGQERLLLHESSVNLDGLRSERLANDFRACRLGPSSELVRGICAYYLILLKRLYDSPHVSESDAKALMKELRTRHGKTWLYPAAKRLGPGVLRWRTWRLHREIGKRMMLRVVGPGWVRYKAEPQ